MDELEEILSSSSVVTKREMLLGAIAALMTGVVIGTYAARPKRPRHMIGGPGCPPPPHGRGECPPPPHGYRECPPPPHEREECPPPRAKQGKR